MTVERTKTNVETKTSHRKLYEDFLITFAKKAGINLDLKNKNGRALLKMHENIMQKLTNPQLMKKYMETAGELARKYKKSKEQILQLMTEAPVSKEEMRKEQLRIAQARKRRIDTFDKMSLQQIIDSCKDPKQKASWERIKQLKWPRPKRRVKLVIVSGGLGMNTDPDAKKMIASLRKVYKDKLTIVRIPYKMGSRAKGAPTSALARFRREVQKQDNSDLIIPLISGHGSSDKRNNNFVFQEHSKQRQNLDRGLSSEDFRKVVKENKDKKFMFMIDTCFAGSATDDNLSKEPNLLGIIAASGKNKVSGDTKSGGLFTAQFSKYVSKGMELGEAFIRTDAIYSNAQNPSAVFNTAGRRIDVN